MSYSPAAIAKDNAPICVRCKWHRLGFAGVRLCALPQFITMSMLSGDKLMPHCEKMRRSGEPCGPQGRFYEAKLGMLARIFGRRP